MNTEYFYTTCNIDLKTAESTDKGSSLSIDDLNNKLG